MYQKNCPSFSYLALTYWFRKFGLIHLKRNLLSPQFDDIEAEITYLFIREFRPEKIVEISPCGGWSTSWILNALKDNKSGQLWSFDLIDDSTKVLPESLKDRWHFIKGDIKENVNKLPKKIDYLFLDSEHSAEFAKWYIRRIFPLLQKRALVSVHDVFSRVKPSDEGRVVINWLRQRNIKYFTVSPAREIVNYNRIISKKKELGIDSLINRFTVNSSIFLK